MRKIIARAKVVGKIPLRNSRQDAAEPEGWEAGATRVAHASGVQILRHPAASCKTKHLPCAFLKAKLFCDD
ncbi:MAG: hypothetical protein M3Y82_09360 [Verrucomicrobiota bacterium]|nr:hypothetical protein [Verrucomicrobiota bacterium]